MKRSKILSFWLCLFCTGLWGQQPLQHTAGEAERTLSADSLITKDARLDSLFQTIPEVMIMGERPVVKAESGKLVYNLPQLLSQSPADGLLCSRKKHESLSMNLKNKYLMKRSKILSFWLCLFCTGLWGQQPLQHTAGEAERTLSADSLITKDARLDSLFQTIPEVMIMGERPVVKAESGKLVYNLPQLLSQSPADNAYEAVKQLPGVSELNGG